MTGGPAVRSSAPAPTAPPAVGGATTDRVPLSWRPLGFAVVGFTLLLSGVSLLLPVLASHPVARGDGGVRLYVWVAEDHNLPAWWAVCLLAWAALLHGLVACLLRSRRWPGAGAWATTAGLLALLSLHELSRLHGKAVDAAGRFLGLDEGDAAVAVGAAAALALATVAFAASRHAPRRSARLLLLSAVLLLCSSWGMEALAGPLGVDEGSGAAFALLVHAQELGEDLGAVAACASAIAALVWERSSRGVHVTLRARS